MRHGLALRYIVDSLLSYESGHSVREKRNQAFVVRAPQLWSSQPEEDLRLAGPVTPLKSSLKVYLLQKPLLKANALPYFLIHLLTVYTYIYHY